MPGGNPVPDTDREMIKVENKRTDHLGFTYTMSTVQTSPRQALWSLLRYEMAFGGKVEGRSDTKIEIMTPVLRKKDTTVFSGLAEEMLLLQAGLDLFLKTAPSEDQVWERVQQWAPGREPGTVNPLKAVLSLPFAAGDGFTAPRTRVIYAALVLPEGAVTDSDNPAFGRLLELEDSDYLAAIDLACEGICLSEIV